MASIQQSIADLSKMMDQLLKSQEEKKARQARRDEILEQIQSSLDELLSANARAGKQSVLETTTTPDSLLRATPTGQALSESSVSIIPPSGQPLQLQDVVSSEPNAGANNRVPQVEVPTLFATDSLSILMLNDAEISEESFETKLDVSNTVSDLRPLPICENAAVYLSSIPLARKTFNDNWCSMQVFYIAAVYLKPPWEPPDDRNYPMLCVDNDLVLSKPTAIGTPRLGMGGSNSDIGLEDLALDSDSTSPIEKLVKYGRSNLDEGVFMGESLLKELEGLSKYKGTGKQHISSNENRPHLVDSILYSSLIDGPCKDGREKNALDMFSLMVEKGREPTLLTYNSLIEGLCHEDVMLNDESKQETPAVVCFGEKQRFIGTAGAASTMINPKNAISRIKRLVGRQISDPELQKNLAGFPFCVKEGQDGYPLINVQYLGETRSFTPTQLLGMVLSILKGIAEKNLGAAVVDVPEEEVSFSHMRNDFSSQSVLNETEVVGWKEIQGIAKSVRVPSCSIRNAHKVFDMLLMVNAESKMFDKGVEVVDYREENGTEIDERACMVLLLALKRADQVDMSLKFFRRMVDANVSITVYSMAIAVDGLCGKSETDQAGVFTSSKVKIVDGNFVYDKGKGHKYNKKNDLKTYEHLGQDIGELKLVLSAFPHELYILLGCKDVLLKLARLVKPPPLPPGICHNRSSHIGNDVSVSEEKASRRPFEVLSNPNCLDGLQTYSHLLVLYINGEFVTAYGIVSRLPKHKPCYSYELLNAILIHEALLSSRRQIFTPLTYNALIGACAGNDDLKKALNLTARMRRKLYSEIESDLVEVNGHPSGGYSSYTGGPQGHGFSSRPEGWQSTGEQGGSQSFSGPSSSNLNDIFSHMFGGNMQAEFKGPVIVIAMYNVDEAICDLTKAALSLTFAEKCLLYLSITNTFLRKCEERLEDNQETYDQSGEQKVKEVTVDAFEELSPAAHLANLISFFEAVGMNLNGTASLITAIAAAKLKYTHKFCQRSEEADSAFLVCFVNKFFMFSSPRPPEEDNLEDKVILKEGVMLRIQISRSMGT